MFSTRLEPTVYNFVKAHPEGPRAYIERLVTADIEQAQPSTPASAGEDVPGQLLLNGSSPPSGPVTEAKPKKASKRGNSSTEQEIQ